MGVGLIDYGAGNFGSVRNALRHIGALVDEVRGPEDFDRASCLVLPGVGSFKTTVDRLNQRGIAESLRDQVLSRGKPLLGICVGMQVMADRGYEFEPCDGLSLIPGEVRSIETHGGERLPHIGWNTVDVDRACPLFDGLDSPTFYFAHSYNFQPRDPQCRMATCEYGSGVTACVGRDRVFGVQFHPEKSQRDGLRLLENFVALAK